MQLKQKWTKGLVALRHNTPEGEIAQRGNSQELPTIKLVPLYVLTKDAAVQSKQSHLVTTIYLSGKRWPSKNFHASLLTCSATR